MAIEPAQSWVVVEQQFDRFVISLGDLEEEPVGDEEEVRGVDQIRVMVTLDEVNGLAEDLLSVVARVLAVVVGEVTDDPEGVVGFDRFIDLLDHEQVLSIYHFIGDFDTFTCFDLFDLFIREAWLP